LAPLTRTAVVAASPRSKDDAGVGRPKKFDEVTDTVKGQRLHMILWIFFAKTFAKIRNFYIFIFRKTTKYNFINRL
jgi:hypothetical protein